jgi:ubiquinone biosynthesis protein
MKTLFVLPDLVRRIEEKYPPKGGAPEAPPLPEIDLIVGTDRRRSNWTGRIVPFVAGSAAMAVAHALGLWG